MSSIRNDRELRLMRISSAVVLVVYVFLGYIPAGLAWTLAFPGLSAHAVRPVELSTILTGIFLYSPLFVPIFGLVDLARGRHALVPLTLCALFWAWWAMSTVAERERGPDWNHTLLSATLLFGLSASAIALGLGSAASLSERDLR